MRGLASLLLGEEPGLAKLGYQVCSYIRQFNVLILLHNIIIQASCEIKDESGYCGLGDVFVKWITF